MKNLPSQTRRYGIAVLLFFVIAAAWISPIDGRAERIVTDSFNRAMITFASARGLNAIISLAKGTEISIGVGAETTFSLGEVLDPIDDLVEQFGDLMLMATVSLGIQKILLIFAKSDIVRWGLTLAVFTWVALSAMNRQTPRLLTGLVMLTLMARFAIPVVAVGTHAMFEAFLKESYDASAKGIERESETIKDEASWWDKFTGEGLAQGQQEQTPDTATRAPQATTKKEAVAPKESSWWNAMVNSLGVGDAPGSDSDSGKAGTVAVSDSPSSVQTPDEGSWWDRAKSGFNSIFDTSKLLAMLREKVDVLKRSTELTAGHVIDLIVVFLLETLVIPLAILWLLYAGVKSILSSSTTKDLNTLVEAVIRESRVRNTVPSRNAVGSA